MSTKIITIVGKSNSGKTTLLEKLIALLTERGYKIGSVKHAHDGFEIDKEGKDIVQIGQKETINVNWIGSFSRVLCLMTNMILDKFD